MSVTVTTKTEGIYTFHYAHHDSPLGRDHETLIALSGATHWEFSPMGQYSPSKTHSEITFVSSFFTADQRKFLPTGIMTKNEDIPAVVAVAAEWYVAEYDLYLQGIDTFESDLIA